MMVSLTCKNHNTILFDAINSNRNMSGRHKRLLFLCLDESSGIRFYFSKAHSRSADSSMMVQVSTLVSECLFYRFIIMSSSMFVCFPCVEPAG